ncbi:hypothetical protein HZH66_011414 [Vespula vulgaris]|uniref:Uncharacterized protein n=1 Tax=Vespula vulgaris TaxID=7454 RepID=A0A834JFN2_VESVU|nr:hypothetical protein HZH66_011414 [Vespula vulgaris]
MGIVSRTQNDTVSSPRIIEQTWALHRDPVRPPVDRLSALKRFLRISKGIRRVERLKERRYSFFRSPLEF